jgi:3-hydroxyisobutyrate dehydrogenase-like beta-hydroxyacid dehydrogenase
VRIAVLGLGQMGRALATRLVTQGHDVTVWNRSPGRASGLGATEAPDRAAAVAGAAVVMSFLTNDDAVIDVLLPVGELLPLDPGAVVVECSTVSPATTRSLAVAYHDQLVACPVLGSPGALEAGQAALAVAGPSDLVDGLAPLWSDLSARVLRCGEDPGLALVLKLVSNYLLMGGVALLSEAVVAGQRAGLGNDLLTTVLSASPLVAPALHNRLDDLIAGDHAGWFPTPMGAKDVHLLLELAAAHSTVLPVGQAVEARYAEAAASGLADLDITAVIELARRPA